MVPAPSRIATASAAFCSRLVSAWRISRRSHGTTGPRSGMSVCHAICGRAVFCSTSASRAICPRSSGLITGCGMRAKAENSSTMRPISPTWRMMVSAHWPERLGIGLDFLGEAALQPLGGELDRGQRVLDLVRDAARHVGPGGLALRRLQFGDVVEGQHEAVGAAARQVGADAHQQRAAAVAVGRSALPRCARAPASRRPRRSARRIPAPPRPTGGRSRRAGRGPATRPRRGWAARCGPCASRPITPAETPDSTVSVKRRRSSIWL